jgi:transaldolase
MDGPPMGRRPGIILRRRVEVTGGAPGYGPVGVEIRKQLEQSGAEPLLAAKYQVNPELKFWRAGPTMVEPDGEAAIAWTPTPVWRCLLDSAGRMPGPQIWLQGDPEEIRDMMPLGISGIITNNIILRDMAQKYNDLQTLLNRYLELEPEVLVVEVDGDTYEDFMYAADAAVELSEKVMVKIVTKPVGIRALATLRDRGIRTMATTIFSLNQAVLMAAAGATWVAPFVGPTMAWGGDGFELVNQISEAYKNRPNTPGIMAGIIRDAAHAHVAYAAGADAIITFPSVYWEMLSHPGTEEWNRTFRDAWTELENRDQLGGFLRE